MKHKKYLLYFLALVIAISVCACGGKTETTEVTNETENLSEEIVGSWILQGYDKSVIPQLGNVLEFYKGGTGKGFELTNEDWEESKTANQSEQGYYSLTYEIEDDIINIKNEGYPNDMGKSAYELKDGLLCSVDGKYVYKIYEK